MKNRLWTGALLLFFVVAGTARAWASVDPGVRRVALLVGHAFGGEGLVPLRYVRHDVERMREALLLAGGFAAEDLLVSINDDVETVLEHLTELNERLSDGKAGVQTLLLFYYSGHAEDGELRLGDDRLSLSDLKRRIQRSRADLRLAFLDSCRSGGITRLKGARAGPSVHIDVSPVRNQRGLVLITASSADEDAQESDRLQGSFFTHFLASGLRGAADQNGDNKVTLSEAYEYTYVNTVERTMGSRGGVQHPSYRFDVRGAGEVVLARPANSPSRVIFPRGVPGDFVVFDKRRRVVIADFSTGGATETRIGLLPGAYALKLRQRDHLRIRELHLDRGDSHRIDPRGWERVEFADDTAKGRVITLEEVRRGPLTLHLGAALGSQVFLSTPFRRAYIDNLMLLGLTLDIDNLLRRNLGLRFDLAFGRHQAEAVSLTGNGVRADRRLGLPTPATRASEFTGGAAIVWRWPWNQRLHSAVSLRLGAIVFNRTFDVGATGSAAIPDQPFATLTPGIGVETDVALLDWLRLGVQARLHYIFFRADESQSLAYLDWGVRLTTVLP